jgi:hypothetical protein
MGERPVRLTAGDPAVRGQRVELGSARQAPPEPENRGDPESGVRVAEVGQEQRSDLLLEVPELPGRPWQACGADPGGNEPVADPPLVAAGETVPDDPALVAETDRERVVVMIFTSVPCTRAG